MLEPYVDTGVEIVVGMESRGFIFSAPMAYLLKAGLVPVRKLGKLPAETLTVEYALEYGSNTLEIHRDAIKAGQKVLIVDDLLATGGTVRGTIELVERLQGTVVGLAFLVELEFLKGRERLQGPARHERHPVLTGSAWRRAAGERVRSSDADGGRVRPHAGFGRPNVDRRRRRSRHADAGPGTDVDGGPATRTAMPGGGAS